jgi:RNA-binding protein
MLNSKQRSYLRSLAMKIQPIFQVGKNGIEDAFLKQVESALEARELIKISVLDNSEYSAREASDYISERLECDGVQAIGRKFVLYKKSKKNPKIELPK